MPIRLPLRPGRSLLTVTAVLGALALALAMLPRAVAATPEAGRAAVSAAAPRAAEDPQPFSVDSVHSTLNFRLRHFGVSNFWGRINKPTGTFWIDGDDLAASSVHIMVEVKNMDAGNDGRNRFLLSPDFFNVREYPTAEFKSESIRKGENGTFVATGVFTLHGVTKPLTATIRDYTTATLAKFGFRGGFECVFTVRRSEYGMDLFVEEGTLGDEVTIIAAIEGVQRPE